MQLTEQQFTALIEYIDAAIEKALDNNQGSDEGLLSAIRKSQCEEDLRKLFLHAQQKLTS